MQYSIQYVNMYLTVLSNVHEALKISEKVTLSMIQENRVLAYIGLLASWRHGRAGRCHLQRIYWKHLDVSIYVIT